MRARIAQLPKTTGSSGAAYDSQWTLEWGPSQRRVQDPLMGWFGSGDTQAQIHLHFDTAEEAIAYAEKAGIAYDVELPPIRVHKPKVYADNFKYDRLENWTH